MSISHYGWKPVPLKTPCLLLNRLQYKQAPIHFGGKHAVLRYAQVGGRQGAQLVHLHWKIWVMGVIMVHSMDQCLFYTVTRCWTKYQSHPKHFNFHGPYYMYNLHYKKQWLVNMSAPMSVVIGQRSHSGTPTHSNRYFWTRKGKVMTFSNDSLLSLCVAWETQSWRKFYLTSVQRHLSIRSALLCLKVAWSFISL